MESCVGQVTHYFNHISVAVISLETGLKINDMIHILGHTTDFYQKVWSMEVDHHTLLEAGAGAQVAIKVAEPVHKGDSVFFVPEGEREPDLMLGF